MLLAAFAVDTLITLPIMKLPETLTTRSKGSSA